MKRLPDAELEVMKVLWELGPDTSRSEVEGGLAAFGWAANTVNTYLSRLADKGFVSVRREGKTNLYTPLISKAHYQEEEGKTILGKLYAGSLRRFAAALHDGGSLRREDVDELRAYLDQLEEEAK